MKTRFLGSKQLEVTALGLGCMGMSTAYGSRDDAESIETIHRAIDKGVNFIDTSDAYANGVNEELVGKALQGYRDEVILATKFGNIMKPGGGEVRGDPEYVVEACNKSLQRLGVDVIDLFYQHRVDTNVPIEDTIGAMKSLIDDGKVRYLGLSEAGANTIRRANAVYPITAVQTEYSLWSRDVEAEILPICRELGIGFVAYAPLGRGFLTGTIRKPEDLIETDRRHDHPRFQPENMQQNVNLLNSLDRLATAKNCTPAQIAIAWVLSKGEDVVPIFGTKRRSYLDENLGALGIDLSDQDIDSLEQVFVPGVTAGTRYPGGQMKRVGV